MAGKSDALETAWLDLFFLGTTITGIADDTVTSPLTAFWVALHTGDPTDSGNQTSSECTYGSYARISVTRDTDGWTRSGSSVSPVADIVFPAASSGSETVTHWSIGSAETGTGTLFYIGTVSPNIPVSTPIAPRITSGSTITED